MCIGCQLANNQITTKVLIENAFFNVIFDIDPIFEGHILILPKRHIEKYTQLSTVEVAVLQSTIEEAESIITNLTSKTSFTLMTNQGEVNDLNGHLHIHLIPRSKGDGFLD